MLYTILRVVISSAAAAIAFVLLHTMRGVHVKRNETRIKAYTAVIFFAMVFVLNFLPIENLFMSFSSSESAFKYNHSGTVIEISEYDNCAIVIAATGEENVTATLIPNQGGRWKLATNYNQKRYVVSSGYYVAEKRCIPNSDDFIVIVAHGTAGNSLDAPTNVADSSGTKFNAVTYNDVPTFYYGYVVADDKDYMLMINGEKVKFN